MTEKDDINERRRQRIRAQKREELTKDIAEELDDSERASMEKRLEQHKEPVPFQHFKPPTCESCGAVFTYGAKKNDECPQCGELRPYEIPAVLTGSPMAVPPHGLMPKLRHKDMDPPAWRTRWGFRLARWSLWWKKQWRRLFPKKPAPKTFGEQLEERSWAEYEERKRKLFEEKGDDDGIRHKDTDEQRPGRPASQ